MKRPGRNLANEQRGIVDAMSRELRVWQEFVLRSLSGADYQE